MPLLPISVSPVSAAGSTISTSGLLVTSLGTIDLPTVSKSVSKCSTDIDFVNGATACSITKLNNTLTNVVVSTVANTPTITSQAPVLMTNALIVPHITIAAAATASPVTSSSTMVTNIKKEDNVTLTPATLVPAISCTPSISIIKSGDCSAPLTTVKPKLENGTCASTSDGMVSVLSKSSCESSDVTSSQSNGCASAADSAKSDFDPIKDLEWKDGIATLPGSNFKFCLNEFGVMEIVGDADVKKEITPQVDTSADASTDEANDSDDLSLPLHLSCTSDTEMEAKGQPNGDKIVKKIEKEAAERDTEERKTKESQSLIVNLKPIILGSSEELRRCQQCNQYGLASEFCKSGKFCSPNCINNYAKEHLPEGHNELLQQKKKFPSENGDHNRPIKIEERPVMRRGRPLGSKTVHKKVKGFSWHAYLEETKGVGAPTKLFKDPFPCYRNGFRVGMKLEGVDPCHQSMFCVLTVAEVCGFRVRLHFDGFSESFDFWVNADSMDILPVGWCEKTGHKLQLPEGFTPETFSWADYLKLTRSQAAPKYLFSNKSHKTVTPHGFRVGMKLEAVDKKNTTLVCVATVADVMDNRFLVHFDGWDDAWDYWADPTSPYIHPVGWCEERGHVLTPPNNYKDPTKFTWEAYFLKTKSQAAPARAFKLRPESGFKRGMKLEVVDRRNPALIRVSSVADVVNHQIKIHFDGWSDTLDYWVDDDSPDLHPIGWCVKTGHPLQPPPTCEELTIPSLTGCPTPGCKGMGHIKGPKFTSHHSAFGCPYSLINLSKESSNPDRILGTKDGSGEVKKSILDTQLIEMKKCPTPGCDGSGHVTGKFTAHHKTSGCPIFEKLKNRVMNGEDFSPQTAFLAARSALNLKPVQSRGRRKMRIPIEDQPLAKEMRLTCDTYVSTDSSSSELLQTSTSKFTSVSSTSPNSTKSANQNTNTDLKTSVHQSVFMPPAARNQAADIPFSWQRHSKLLPGLNRYRGKDVHRWNIEQVSEFVYSLPGCMEVAKIFKEEQIDGEAFMLLTQSDIVKLMNIKLGPALKIYNSILMFQSAAES